MEKSKSAAFTLIELLVVISIVIITSSLAIAHYLEFNQEQILKDEAKNIVTIIGLAKKKASVSDLYDQNCIDFGGYKIKVNDSNLQMYFLCSSTEEEVQKHDLSQNISVSSGVGEINFFPMVLNTTSDMSLITLKNSSINKCININLHDNGNTTIEESIYSCP